MELRPWFAREERLVNKCAPIQPTGNRVAITERVTHRRDYPKRLRRSPNQAEAGRSYADV